MGKEASLAKRLRYYQAMMDTTNLKRGQDYAGLPASFIIFFCGYDPFGKRQALYDIRRECANVTGVEVGSQDRWLVFNFKDYERCRVKELLKYFQTGQVGEHSLTKSLDAIVDEMNSDKGWVSDMVTLADQRRWDIERAVVSAVESTRLNEQQRIRLLAEKMEREQRASELIRALRDLNLLHKLYEEFNL